MSLEDLIEPSDFHRRINGTQLTIEREKRGLNQFQLATECGWSQPYQSQLEAPGWHEIPKEHADKIIMILASFLHNVPQEPAERMPE